MKKINSKLVSYCFILLSINFTACQAKEVTIIQKNEIDTVPDEEFNVFQGISTLDKKTPIRNYSQQIGQFVREVYQDIEGNLWFGTLEYGLARYDGKSLVYFTTTDGLADNQINDIVADKSGNLWITTNNGITRVAKKSLSKQPIFTNFREEDGLVDNSTWSILVDKSGEIWVGTMNGISRYDGQQFSIFVLPKAPIKNPTAHINLNLVWEIIEDKNGDLWFGRDGYGVCKYTRNHQELGKPKFTHFTKKDGLSSNSVMNILEDTDGNTWFGSRTTRVASKDNPYLFSDSKDAGLARYDGNSFVKFPEIDGLTGSVISPMYKDSKGNIWIASMHHGVYRYDGKSFKNFKENQGLTINCIQSILEDKDGVMWFGFSGGLFQFDGVRFLNMKRSDF